MSLTDTSVKWFHDGMRGAPVIYGAAGGGYIPALRAFLLTGFGATVATSVTVADGVATAVLSVSEGFEKYAVIAISGADDADLNGEARITGVSGMTVSWATAATDGSKTGTIVLKYAPAGWWEEVFTGTDVAVFRSTHPMASGFCIRVDDSAAQFVRVTGYESMTDEDTGIGPFPTAAQVAGGGYWVKCSATSGAPTTTPIGYVFAADPLFFVSALAAAGTTAGNNIHIPRGFGDPISMSPAGDPYACCLSAAAQSTLSTIQWNGSLIGSSSVGGVYSARGLGGLGGSVATESYRQGATGAPQYSMVSGNDGAGGALADAPGGVVLASPHWIKSASNSGVYRAQIPGVYSVAQIATLVQLPAKSILPVGARRMLVVPYGGSSYQGSNADRMFLLDITGPWR